jgi:YD repeat-containing protein
MSVRNVSRSEARFRYDYDGQGNCVSKTVEGRSRLNKSRWPASPGCSVCFLRAGIHPVMVPLIRITARAEPRGPSPVRHPRLIAECDGDSPPFTRFINSFRSWGMSEASTKNTLWRKLPASLREPFI